MKISDFIDIITQAGHIALAEQENLNVQTKEDKSIVTNGDLAVSKYLETELKKRFPAFDVFSEENSQQIPTSKKVFIIDPIDGTESYSRNQGSWSILIGVLDDLVPVGGIVYQPASKTLYYAFKGAGAFMESDGVVTSLTCERAGKILNAVISPKDYEEKAFLEKRNVTSFIPLYSAALKIMEVAKGNVDLYPNFRKKCSWWDLIAPTVILTEAGGELIYEESVAIDFNKTWVNSKFCAIGNRIKSDIFKETTILKSN